jgi:hypothetical protein
MLDNSEVQVASYPGVRVDRGQVAPRRRFRRVSGVALILGIVPICPLGIFYRG